MAAFKGTPVVVGINVNKVFQLRVRHHLSSKGPWPAPHTAEMEIMAINHAVVVTGLGEEMVGGRAMKYWIPANLPRRGLG